MGANLISFRNKIVPNQQLDCTFDEMCTKHDTIVAKHNE